MNRVVMYLEHRIRLAMARKYTVSRMGKVARKIVKIINPRDRRITFRKRHEGVMKKIHELGILCDQDTFLFVRDRTTQRVRVFSSSNEQFMPHYPTIKQEDRKGPDDMQRHYKKSAERKDNISAAQPSATLRRDESGRRRMVVFKTLLEEVQVCQRILQAAAPLRLG